MSALSKFGKLESARTHDESRAIVCCVCWKKVKQNQPKGVVKVLTDRLSQLVRKFVYDGYSDQNTAHPTAMCGNCRLILCALDKVFA